MATSVPRIDSIQRSMRALMMFLIATMAALVITGEGAVAPQAMAAPASALEELRQLDRRVAVVAHQLATQNVDLCLEHTRWTGLVLHNLAQYAPAYRDAVKATFRLDEYRPGVLAIVPDSSAAAAGMMEDDLITAIDGDDIPPRPLPSQSSYAAIYDTLSALEAVLKHGPVRLTLLNEIGVRDVFVEGVPGCISRVELIPGPDVAAASDGQIVEVSGALARFVRDDDELAVVVGHEMAHNILKHADRLERAGVAHDPVVTLGRNASLLRAAELDADYLGLYLMARAGYDIAAVISFWQRFGRKHGAVIFGSSTYPPWSQRRRLNSATIAEIEASLNPCGIAFSMRCFSVR